MSGYIGISSGENTRSSEFWANFLQLKLPELVTPPEVARGACISDNRNKLTARAIELKADWIFYVDDDQLFHPEALIRLLNHRVNIVSGLYLSREFPFQPVVFDRPSEDSKVKGAYQMILSNLTENHGIIKVAAIGAGALLVRLNVFQKLKKPYWTLGQVDPSCWGDDLDFCYRVRQAGFNIYCDLDERVGHKVQGAIWPLYDKESGWSTTLVVTEKPIVSLPQVTEEAEVV